MINGGKFDVYFTNFNIANRSTAFNAQYRAYFSNIFQLIPFFGKSILRE